MNKQRSRPIRSTRQRQVILEELRKVTCHPTADEVYQIVRRRLPRISLGTVYRNLDLLAATAAIQRLELAGAQRRYDGNPESHVHVRCLKCGRVADLLVAQPELTPVPAGVTDYQIVGQRVEYVGVCPGCQGSEHSDITHVQESGLPDDSRGT